MTKGKTEAFVKISSDLIESAWRSLGINARRLLDFLMLEHMRHGGKANGRLIAPRRQLEKFRIGQHFVSSAIEECQRVGLHFCQRGTGRSLSRYTVTWLPLSDGQAPPDGKWRTYNSRAWQMIASSAVAVEGCSPLPPNQDNLLP
jgi:hypothetical protein